MERRMMVGEIFKKLNNAEKICYADGHAAILYREGSYYFTIIPSIYEKYAKIYGTDCSDCGKKD